MSVELKITIKKMAVNCPRGNEFMKLAMNLGVGDKIPVPLFVAPNQASQLMVYAEEVKPENGIGRIEKIFDKNAKEILIEDFKEELVFTYDLKINGFDTTGNLMIASFEKQKTVNVKVNTSSNIENEIKRIISEGIMDEKTVRENVEIMKAHRIDEILMTRTLAQYRKYKKSLIAPKTIFVDPSPEKKGESLLSECLRGAVDRFAIIYEGDKSVGKNVCAETITKILGMPYYLVTFNRMMSPDDIYGTKSTDNSASAKLTLELALSEIEVMQKGEKASPEAIHKAAEFELYKAQAASVSIVQDVSEFVEWLVNGGVMVFNEMNMAEANFLASFANQITDNTGYIFIPGRGRIDINKDCVLIGTQNAEYTGTCEQNDATTSRFGCIEFPYPKSIKKQLMAVVGKDTLDVKYFEQCDNLYKCLLKAVQDGTISNTCLNIRGFIRALTSTANSGGYSKLIRQIDIHVIGTCPTDERDTLRAQLTDKVSL